MSTKKIRTQWDKWKPLKYLRFDMLKGLDWFGYRLTAYLFYPINRLLALLFRKRRGNGVLHISTVTHQPYLITRHLRAQGFNADFLAKGEGWLSYDEKGWDFRTNRTRLPGPIRFLCEFWQAWTLYPRYEIIHSHFLQMIGSGFWELPFLKRMGKKVVFHFRGDDIRRKKMNLQLNPDLNCCQECDYPDEYCRGHKRDFLAQKARRYGSLFLVTTPDLNDFFPEAIHFPFMLPELPGQIPPLRRKERLRRPSKILHLTNHEGIDGTNYLAKAVHRLREEGYEVELLIPQRVPFQEILRMYPEVDISVGKLRMGYYANAQIESMYFGIPTMCYIRENFIKKIPDCPIINVRPENLYQKLKYYLDHPDEMMERGRRGQEFVRKFHSGDLLAKRLIEMYQNC
jgi:hypothetical protein